MNREEAAKLLGVIALGDNRQISRELAVYWHGLLIGIRIEDALQAVAEHRRTSTEWLQPAHIVRIVQRDRGHRIDDANLTYNGNPDEDPQSFLAAHRARLNAAGDGQVPAAREQLALGHRPVAALVASVPPPPDVREAVLRSRARRGPLSVRCPFCCVPAGTPCRAGKHNKSGFYHPARIADAQAAAAEQAAEQAAENARQS